MELRNKIYGTNSIKDVKAETRFFVSRNELLFGHNKQFVKSFLMLANFVDCSQPQGVQRTASKLS